MTIADSDPTPRRGLAILLPDHHRRLEAKCRALLAAANTDDCRDVVASWRALESELLDHVLAEEEVILPSYRAYAPADAARILDEHARIREVVAILGPDVELHEIRLVRLQHLVTALHLHTAHEDELMYPWAERNLGEVARHQLATRLGRWFATSAVP